MWKISLSKTKEKITDVLDGDIRYLEKTKNLVFLAFIIFFFLAYMAHLVYPFPYSFSTDWISNLGNGFLNPRGAIYFNLACILSGFILIVVFVRAFNFLISLAGILMSVFFVLVGIFPSNMMFEHTIFGNYFFLACIASISLISFSIRDSYRNLAYLGIVIILINLFFLSISKTPFFEWIAFIANFFYILFMAYFNFGLFLESKKLGK